MSNSSRTVVLFGKAGAGKSTIGNMLLSEEGNGQAFVTGNSANSVTRLNERKSNEDKTWTVIDTIGLDSAGNTSSDEAITTEIVKFTKGEAIHNLCYVKKATKFTIADERCWQLFKRLVGKHHDDHVLLVFTSCPEGWMEENDADISEMMGSQSGSQYRRIGVDFPPVSRNSGVEMELQKERVKQKMHLIRELREVPDDGITLEPSTSPWRSIFLTCSFAVISCWYFRQGVRYLVRRCWLPSSNTVDSKQLGSHNIL